MSDSAYSNDDYDPILMDDALMSMPDFTLKFPF
jgi:hypothetical protein